MCGIVGYTRYSNSCHKYDIHQMIDSIRHRGPDNISVWENNNISLAHARLSIIDLKKESNQPQHFKNLHIVFNGEIFNYLEIKAELEAKGYMFLTDGDTEVILKSFHLWKEGCVDRFEGMFSFCIYDDILNELHIFRDRVGIKPLYYIHTNDSFIFASEARALYPYSKRVFDLVAIQEYFSFGYIGKERTAYTDVKKLLPGHYLKVTTENEIRIDKYWDLQNYNNNRFEGKTEESITSNLEEIMYEAFSSHMVSDVPVGIFLSGGVDSSLVTALLAKSNNNISTFTMGFSENKFNEAPLARQISEHLGTKHYEKILFLEEAKKALHDFYNIYDEPFADSSGIPTSILASFVKDNGCKVVLSADGGDELFAGYGRYEKTYRLWKRLNNMPKFGRKYLSQSMKEILNFSIDDIKWKNLGNKFSKLSDLLSGEECSILYQYIISNGNAKKAKELIGIEQNQIFRDGYLFKKGDIQGMMNWDFMNYLPDDLLVKMDRATMYHGIEGREPMLDHRIVEAVAGLPMQYKLHKNSTKYILKKILKQYIPSSLAEQPKKGFSIPLFDWFSSDLDQLFDKYLNFEMIKQTNLLDPEVVEIEMKKYKYFKKHGMSSNMERMWRLLSFMLWWEKYHQDTTNNKKNIL